VIYDCLHAGTAQTSSYSTDLGSRWKGWKWGVGCLWKITGERFSLWNCLQPMLCLEKGVDVIDKDWQEGQIKGDLRG